MLVPAQLAFPAGRANLRPDDFTEKEQRKKDSADDQWQYQNTPLYH